MTRYIEHIIEPNKLLMTWQDKQSRVRYTVAELSHQNNETSLIYLTETKDFLAATKAGFDSYPAFQNLGIVHTHGVLEALMRRVPPKSREDFPQYLEALRIKPDTYLSDFALLGYSGAKLPSDNFAIINPFENVASEFEFLLEASGYKHLVSTNIININDEVSFQKETTTFFDEEPIKICLKNQIIGYVTRALLPSFHEWINSHRIVDAWIEKKNGTPEFPTVYIYVKISKKS